MLGAWPLLYVANGDGCFPHTPTAHAHCSPSNMPTVASHTRPPHMPTVLPRTCLLLLPTHLQSCSPHIPALIPAPWRICSSHMPTVVRYVAVYLSHLDSNRSHFASPFYLFLSFAPGAIFLGR